MLIAAVWSCVLLPVAVSYAQSPGREHLVFFRDTRQEIEVYKIQGRAAGPTAMLLGGIHGDEPGAYLSADLYADLIPLRGNLIIVPRANFQAVLHGQRGPYGDMNRKFGDVSPDDPDGQVVAVLKSLMAESDLLLSLHDGSGFYRPEWVDEQTNPKRYGQCVITDTSRYEHAEKGVIELEKAALDAIARVNETIEEPRYAFHFFNMETSSDASLYKEHRNSSTYYALTELGIPAFCIETSKNLPGMDMKIRQHNQVINAFLEQYGIELENPGFQAAPPAFSHLVIRVGDGAPLAVSNGQTLHVERGERVEVLHAAANFERGLMVMLQEEGFRSILHKPLVVEKPLSVSVCKDSRTLGRVNVAPFPQGGSGGPAVSGEPSGAFAAFALPGKTASLDMLPGSRLVAARAGHEAGSAPSTPPAASIGRVSAFVVEVDGKRQSVKPGEEVAVPANARLKLVDMQTEGGSLPKGTVMNLKGFVGKENASHNTGEDRGCLVNPAKDMMKQYSEGGKGEIYPINAELRRTVLASCTIRIVPPAVAATQSPPPVVSAASGAKPAQAEKVEEGRGRVTAFLVEVDGKPVSIKPGDTLPVMLGSSLKLVDMQTEGGSLPKGTVMNLRGFVGEGNALRNTGEDRGCLLNPARDMGRSHSVGGTGEVYAINAEHGKTILSACAIRLVRPVLESVTVRIGGQTKVLRLGSRTAIAPGTPVDVLEVSLKGGHTLNKPRYTLAGHAVSAKLPQTLKMRDIAINFAVFNGEELAGKVTWAPGG